MSQQPVSELAAPARILVVDDDLHTRDLLRELCESQGHTVEVADDGPGALAKVEAFSPDLVLLDVMIPGIDGFGVLSKIRGAPKTAQLPVIILTATTDLEGKIRGLELGADDYITKPFRLFELTTRVRAVLTMRAYQERLHAAERELEGLRTGDGPGGTESYPQLRAGLVYELARAKRYERPLAALVLTVANFDAIRGTLGRNDVERFTTDLTTRLRGGLRETDRLFRIDLDEFVVVLPETDAPGADAARKRVLEAMHEFRSDLIVEAGIAVVSDPAAATPEEMMRAAQRDLQARSKH